MRPGRGTNRSSATANVTLYCTWCPSGLNTGLHGQGNRKTYHETRASRWQRGLVLQGFIENDIAERHS